MKFILVSSILFVSFQTCYALWTRAYSLEVPNKKSVWYSTTIPAVSEKNSIFEKCELRTASWWSWFYNSLAEFEPLSTEEPFKDVKYTGPVMVRCTDSEQKRLYKSSSFMFWQVGKVNKDAGDIDIIVYSSGYSVVNVPQKGKFALELRNPVTGKSGKPMVLKHDGTNEFQARPEEVIEIRKATFLGLSSKVVFRAVAGHIADLQTLVAVKVNGSDSNGANNDEPDAPPTLAKGDRLQVKENYMDKFKPAPVPESGETVPTDLDVELFSTDRLPPVNPHYMGNFILDNQPQEPAEIKDSDRLSYIPTYGSRFTAHTSVFDTPFDENVEEKPFVPEKTETEQGKHVINDLPASAFADPQVNNESNPANSKNAPAPPSPQNSVNNVNQLPASAPQPAPPENLNHADSKISDKSSLALYNSDREKNLPPTPPVTPAASARIDPAVACAQETVTKVCSKKNCSKAEERRIFQRAVHKCFKRLGIDHKYKD